MDHLFDRPRLLGLFCAAIAVGLGLAYMAAAGAPMRYLGINLGALVLGAMMWLGLGPRAGARLARDGWAVLALALPLMVTALFGNAVDGASRWMNVGPIAVQISLVVLPALIVLYARRSDAIGTVGIGIAALALAAQPDRAMAGVLAVGMAAVVLTRPSRLSAVALAAAALAFAASMLRPDALPAVPFVDQIIYTAFDVHVAAGVAVVGGCLLLILPAFGGTGQRSAVLAFGATWAAVAIAAAMGNYPTPLVGYGGSAVLGYLLSAGLLPSGKSDATAEAAVRSTDRDSEEQDIPLQAVAQPAK